MPSPKAPKHPNDKIEVEPGADKRLANILKRALNTPPKHKASENARRRGASMAKRAADVKLKGG